MMRSSLHTARNASLHRHVLQMFIGHSGAVACGSFTPDGRTVVTGGGAGDASLRAWSPQTGECTIIISGHSFHQAGVSPQPYPFVMIC